MTIHVPRSISSRLPAHFAIGAAITVVAAIAIGAVALQRESNAPTGDQAFNRPAIIVSEDSVRANEAFLEQALGHDLAAGSVSGITATEDSVRRNEAMLEGEFNMPSAPVVMAPAEYPTDTVGLISPLPPYALDGPAYP